MVGGGLDIAIHCATKYIKSHHNSRDALDVIRTNISFPTELLEHMRHTGIRYFINTGTFFEYAPSDTPIDENHPIRPYNLYAATKQAFSNVLLYYAREQGIKAVELKLFAPYGPRDNEKLFPFLIRNFLMETPFSMSPSEQRWNFTYVSDIVDAYIQSIDYIVRMDDKLTVFNIGQSEVYSVKEVIELLQEMTKRYDLVSYTKPYPENEIFYTNCDNSKAVRRLGWSPRYDLQQGLKETYSYYSTVEG